MSGNAQGFLILWEVLIMNNRELIEQARENIWQAVKDYRTHTSEKDILNDITDSFVNRLAEDSVIAKQELRELFQTSPIWDENLNALVINGTRTHNLKQNIS